MSLAPLSTDTIVRSAPPGDFAISVPPVGTPAPLDPTFGASGIALPPVQGRVADALVQPATVS